MNKRHFLKSLLAAPLAVLGVHKAKAVPLPVEIGSPVLWGCSNVVATSDLAFHAILDWKVSRSPEVGEVWVIDGEFHEVKQ